MKWWIFIIKTKLTCPYRPLSLQSNRDFVVPCLWNFCLSCLQFLWYGFSYTYIWIHSVCNGAISNTKMHCNGFFIIIYLFFVVDIAVCIGRRLCHSPSQRLKQRQTHIQIQIQIQRQKQTQIQTRSQRVAVQFCSSHGHKRQFCIRNGNL